MKRRRAGANRLCVHGALQIAQIQRRRSERGCAPQPVRVVPARAVRHSNAAKTSLAQRHVAALRHTIALVLINALFAFYRPVAVVKGGGFATAATIQPVLYDFDDVGNYDLEHEVCLTIAHTHKMKAIAFALFCETLFFFF